METQDKLWTLVSSPFLVVGEARVTDDEIFLTWLGDGRPEAKLGLAPGTFPKTIRDALALPPPDDAPGHAAGSSKPTAVRCFWTKWASCRWKRRRKCSGPHVDDRAETAQKRTAACGAVEREVIQRGERVGRNRRPRPLNDVA